MFFRARRALSRAWFDFSCREVLRTPAILPGDAGVTLVSMVCHGEVLMYLLAVKSFCRRLGRTPSIVLLDDGSLTGADRALIARHLLDAEIVPIATIDTHGCPRGSCWERLLLIGQRVEHSYVVQLDCDTLTLGAIAEVAECIAANRCFTLLGDKSYPAVESMHDACARATQHAGSMVQAVCERSFNLLPESADLKYLRGNAGFTGFAKGSIDGEKIRWFSGLMRRLVQGRWDEWGSEQVTSNLLIANAPEPYPLPAPKYLSYWAHPDVPYERAAFLHFIGPHRFSNGLYLKNARRVIASSNQPVVKGRL